MNYQARRRRKADKLKGAWSYDGRVYIRDILDGTKEVRTEIEIDTAIFEADRKIAEEPEKYRPVLLNRKSKPNSHVSMSSTDDQVVTMD